MLNESVSTPAPAAGLSVAQTWDEVAELQKWLKTAPASEQTVAGYKRLWALETAVLDGPIRTRADAIAKLKAVQPSFEVSPRDDELDGDALAEATAWLEAHP